MSGRIEFSMGFKTAAMVEKKTPTDCYRIYLLGNFSGGSKLPFEQRKINEINTDNFNQVMSKLAPSVSISPDVNLTFTNLENFHPDTWLNKIPLLADLQLLKKQLSNPATAAEATAKIQALCCAQQTQANTQNQVANTEETESAMLERLLGKAPEPAGTPSGTIEELIKQIVSPHIQTAPNPQSTVLLDLVDNVMSELMRAVLQTPTFQKMEALWLACSALVNEENGDAQSFYLVDIDASELITGLEHDGNAFTQRLLRHIQSGNGEQNVLLIGDFCFNATQAHLHLLEYFNQLAQTCQGTFIAAADAGLCSPENLHHWSNYMQGINTERVILAYPRYLARMPYGTKRDPLESLVFEEASAIPQASELLWGNPAFLCARFLVRTSQGETASGANFFSDIPAFSFAQDGEQHLQPGTETVLTEKQANELADFGFTPVIGFRNRLGVQLLPV